MVSLLLSLTYASAILCFIYSSPLRITTVKDKIHMHLRYPHHSLISHQNIDFQAKLNDIGVFDTDACLKKELYTGGVELLSNYRVNLLNYPITTKMISAASVSAVGDFFMQALEVSEDSNLKISFKRMLIMATVSSVFCSPVVHFWFNLLNEITVPSWVKHKHVVKAVLQTIADQTVGAVVITTLFFFSHELVTLLFTRSAYSKGLKVLLVNAYAQGLESTLTNLWPTLVANWCLWPVVNFINFLLVPLPYRVLFLNSVSLFWNMFLSYTVSAAMVQKAL